MDALPQIPHDAVAMKWRSATADASNGVARRTRIVSSGWLSSPGSPACVARTSEPGDEALGPEEPDGELILVARRSHRDGDRDRVLPGPGGPDLERRLADHAVVAELERGARGPPRSWRSSRGGSARGRRPSRPACRRLQFAAERGQGIARDAGCFKRPAERREAVQALPASAQAMNASAVAA